MKTLSIIAAALLPLIAHAQLGASFTWQGKTFNNPKFELLDANTIRVTGTGAPGFADVPYGKAPMGVQQQLAQQRADKASGAEVVDGHVVRILDEGLFISGRATAGAVAGPVVLLTGYPDHDSLKIGTPVRVLGMPDGSFDFKTQLGEKQTVAKVRYLREAAAKDTARTGTPAPLPGRLQGSTLDPKKPTKPAPPFGR
jgi:hypothetical protein